MSVLLVFASLGVAYSQTAVSVSAQIGNWHIGVANYFHVPQREVVLIRERRIPDDEIPVVLFIAQQARVTPAAVLDLRLGGRSWWDISAHFGLGAEVFYVPVTVSPGPPYGNAYGHYKKPKKQWNTIRLADADIINFVNLRFVSEHHRIAPERVIELRGRKGFVAIDTELTGAHHVDAVVKDTDRGSKGKGKGKGKGKDRGNQ